jgi:hypothetical protein
MGGTPYRGRKPETKEPGQAEACPARCAIEKQQLALEVLTVRYGTYRALVSIQVATPGRGIDRDRTKRKCEATTIQACGSNKFSIRMRAASQALKLAAFWRLYRLTADPAPKKSDHADRVSNTIHHPPLEE